MRSLGVMTLCADLQLLWMLVHLLNYLTNTNKALYGTNA